MGSPVRPDILLRPLGQLPTLLGKALVCCEPWFSLIPSAKARVSLSPSSWWVTSLQQANLRTSKARPHYSTQESPLRDNAGGPERTCLRFCQRDRLCQMPFQRRRCTYCMHRFGRLPDASLWMLSVMSDSNSTFMGLNRSSWTIYRKFTREQKLHLGSVVCVHRADSQAADRLPSGSKSIAVSSALQHQQSTQLDQDSLRRPFSNKVRNLHWRHVQ